ncbi:MAG: ABC transporter permease subunit [Planctomycetota bacterium]
MAIRGTRSLSAKALGFLLAAAQARAALGAGLDEILRRGAVRWGGDQSGGAPYVYEGAGGRLTGFEYDLMDALAGKLGVRSEFVQGQWDKLLQLVDRGDVDVVANGYEWSEEKERNWLSTVPYYVYRLQLLARKGDPNLRSWDDLRKAPRKRVGVLIGSAAERYLEERCARDVDVRSYDGVTNAMTSVAQGQIDATLQDLPIAIHYASEFPELVPVGEPVAPGYYVIFLARGERALKDRLDRAILEALEDGTLRRIYEKYGLWNDDQLALAGAARGWPPVPGGAPGRPDALRIGELLLRAAGTTIALSVLAMPLAIALGLLVATGRIYGPGWLQWPLELYVEFLRGTPVLLQLYVIYYVLPNAGVVIPAFWAGVLGLAINYSAYEAENYRAGFLAVPRGQMEAALSLGMTKRTALRRVIIPQAVRIVIPPVTNDFIALFKDTSVCSVITVVELTGMYNRLSNNQPRLVLELGLAAAALYLLMSYPLSLLVRRLERRLKGPGR